MMIILLSQLKLKHQLVRNIQGGELAKERNVHKPFYCYHVYMVIGE